MRLARCGSSSPGERHGDTEYMRKALIWFARLSLGAAIATIAFPQVAPQAHPVRGGIAREAMYLRLFQEIDQFESQADQLEAQGIAAPTFRGYHQKWLSLSPNHATLLKKVAKSCMQDLRSAGLTADGSPDSAPRLTAERMTRGMVSVRSAVENLAASMGPAQFAYFDSTVRRYLLASVTSRSVSTPRAQISRLGANPGLAATRTGTVASTCSGSGCPYPGYEAIGANELAFSNARDTGGAFVPTLGPSPGAYQDRWVSEVLTGTVYNGETVQYDTCSPLINHSPLPLPEQWWWQITGGGWYDAADDIALDTDYCYEVWAVVSPEGCYVDANQDMYIDDCDHTDYYDFNYSSGMAESNLWWDGSNVWAEAVRQSGGGDVWEYWPWQR